MKLSTENLLLLESAIDLAIHYYSPVRINVGGYKFLRICKRVPVYRCNALGLILKKPAFIMNPKTPQHVRVPTVKMSEGWVVQPVVKKVDRKKAVMLIRKKLGDISCDLHHLNVGWYKGKPVMFDW